MSKKYINVKKNAVAVACSLALAAGAFAPAIAMAAEPTNSTKVVIKASDDNKLNGTDQTVYSVPTKIVMAASKTGDLTAQLIAPNEAKIKNLSVFDIHVSQINVNAADGWTLDNGALAPTATDVLSLTLNEKKLAAVNSATENETEFNGMGLSIPAGNNKDITFGGSIKNVSKDIFNGEVDAATITWTVATGK